MTTGNSFRVTDQRFTIGCVEVFGAISEGYLEHHFSSENNQVMSYLFLLMVTTQLGIRGEVFSVVCIQYLVPHYKPS